MNLDKIFFRSKKSRQVFEEETPAADLVKSRFWHKKGSETLFIVLPPWGGFFYLNFLLRRKILKHGCSLLEYKFPKAILSSNWEITLNNFNKMRDSITEEIKKLKGERAFKKINIVGISIGCVSACMVANNNPLIDETFLIVPGHCLAESMWQGSSTQKIRQSYKNKGITLEELKEYWRGLAPENNVDNLKSKKISIFLSESDVVIPFYCGRKLLDKIESLKYDLFLETNKSFGHALTALLFYLNPEKILFPK